MFSSEVEKWPHLPFCPAAVLLFGEVSHTPPPHLLLKNRDGDGAGGGGEPGNSCGAVLFVSQWVRHRFSNHGSWMRLQDLKMPAVFLPLPRREQVSVRKALLYH